MQAWDVTVNVDATPGFAGHVQNMMESGGPTWTGYADPVPGIADNSVYQ